MPRVLISRFLLALLIACVASACGTGSAPKLAGVDPNYGPAGSGLFQVRMAPASEVVPAFAAPKAPSALRLESVRSASFTDSDLRREASAYNSTLPSNRIMVSGSELLLTPDFTPGSGLDGLAYCTYQYALPGYAENPTIGLRWDSASLPNWQDAWVGIANFTRDRWEWYNAPEDGVLTLPDFTPYLSDTGSVLVTVAITGTAPCTLESVEVGPFELRALGADSMQNEDASSAPAMFSPDNLPGMKDLTVNFPSVRDQGNWGSCTAFAVADAAYTYELSQVYVGDGWDSSQDALRLSPKQLYIVSGELQGFPPSPAHGRYLDQVIEDLVAHGACSELHAPYDSSYDNDWSQDALDDSDVLEIDGWEEIACNSLDGIFAVKSILAVQERPLVMRTNLDNEFLGYAPGEVWNYDGPNIGGHAMCVVGYDDTKLAFKVRNSWSADWGDQGYCWIGYGTFMDFAANVRTFVLNDGYDADVAARFLGAAPPALAAPQALQASDGLHADRITLNWEPVAGADGYRIYRDDHKYNLVQQVGQVSSWEDTTVEDLYSHTYWVKAFNSTSTSANSAPDNGYQASSPAIEYTRVSVQFPQPGQAVVFDTVWHGSAPATFSWDFGSGASPNLSTDTHPNVTLGAEGDYNASVTITNALGSDTYNWVLHIGSTQGLNDPPVPVLQISPTSGAAPIDISFDASGSYDPDGVIIDYQVLVNNDDCTADPLPPHFHYNFYNGGIYDIRLRVWDDNYEMAEYYTALEIDPDPRMWHISDITGASGFAVGVGLLSINGQPAVVYSETGGNVSYRRASNPQGTSWGSAVQIDSGEGYNASLAVVAGRPAVAYGSASGIEYALAADTDGGSWGTPVAASTDGIDWGGLSNLAVVQGRPALAFQPLGAGKDLYYVTAADAEGATWAGPVLVDAINAVGQHPSLAEVAGNPGIAYYDETNKQLMFCRALQADGTSWASPLIVDTDTWCGRGTALTWSDGELWLGYCDWEDQRAWRIRAGNPLASYWTGRQLVRQKAEWPHIYMADVDGRIEALTKDLLNGRPVCNGDAYTAQTAGPAAIADIGGQVGIVFQDYDARTLKFGLFY